MSETNSTTKPEVPADASAKAAAETKPGRTPGTRLLKDVEAEENRILYETLYKSLDDAEDEQVNDDLVMGDTVRGARLAKKEFLDAVTKPMTSKAKDLGTLYQQLSDKRNSQVLSRFVFTSVLMLTIPLIALMVGMKVVAPRLGVDDVLCGGFAAIGSTILIGGGYVIYAFIEDARNAPATAPTTSETSEAAKKKKKAD